MSSDRPPAADGGKPLSAGDGRDPPSAADFDRLVAQALLAAKLVDQVGLDRARRVQEASGGRLHRLLTRLALVSESDLASALARLLGHAVVAEAEYPAAPAIETPLSVRFLKEARAVPLAEEEGRLVVAMADPLDDYTRQALSLATGRQVAVRVGVPAQIEAALDRLQGARSDTGGEVAAEAGDDDGDLPEDVERLRDLAAEAPVIRLVNSLVARAVEARASDIHVEALDGRLRVRYRIDGVMQEVEGPPSAMRAAVVSRIKILAKLNIAERRLPQDGRIRLAVRGKEIDLRVSTVPCLHGESVVMRILDRGTVALDLVSLGFEGAHLARLLDMVERPNGIVLVTGPTGSGKTTTLYAALRRLNTVARKIHTVEDPIEYQLDGVTQIQVKPQIGLTFAGVLRHILRQDPDVVLVGEIRDLETAQIAMQASLTGHLVLSTLHTNSAAASITRLTDMGVEDYLLGATVNGVCAQRLVRLLCPQCRRLVAAGSPFRRAVGCGQCHGTGYHGRTVVAELLPMTDTIRRLVRARADVGEIERAAVAEGMVPMMDAGLAKAAAGLTSEEEVLRVIGAGAGEEP